MDAGDVTDIINAEFDGVVNMMLKVKISVKGHPKILCMSVCVKRVTEDLNR